MTMQSEIFPLASMNLNLLSFYGGRCGSFLTFSMITLSKFAAFAVAKYSNVSLVLCVHEVTENFPTHVLQGFERGHY